MSRPQGHSGAGRNRSTEKYINLIGNQTGDLPACSIVPQPLQYRVKFRDIASIKPRSILSKLFLIHCSSVILLFYATEVEALTEPSNDSRLTHGPGPFLRNRQLCSHSRTSQQFMEHESSLSCSQEPSTGPYPSQIDLIHTITSYLSQIYFRIVHPPTSWSCSLPSNSFNFLRLNISI
jgi:hypothetical protein